MPNGKTKTYVLDGKTYTVPADTSMDELDQYIRGQSATGPRPIQDTSTISARPSLGSRAWSAFKEGGPTALGQELGESTRSAIGGLPLPGVNKNLGQGLQDLGQMANMASTEASLLQAPQLVEGIVGAARGGLPLLGNKVASLLRKPATAAESQVGSGGAVKDILPMVKAPPWLVPKGELGTPTNPGPFSKIPARLTKAQISASPEPFTGQPRAGLNPPPAAPDISQLPEPIQRFPSENPGYMASIPRKQLLGMADRGKLGAGEQLQQLGQKVLYTPRGVVSGERVPLPWETSEPVLGNESTQAASPGTQLAPQQHRFSNSARTRQQILDLANEQPAEEGGETGLDAILRGAPGENPSYKSLLRNLQKTRKAPLF